jgi:hypothetical protein
MADGSPDDHARLSFLQAKTTSLWLSPSPTAKQTALPGHD